MGDLNGRIDSPVSVHANDSLSPPSIKDGRCDKNDIFRSNTSSPLLETEPIPLDDQTHCSYCHKDFRKPRVLDCLHSMCEDCIIAQLDGRKEIQKAHELASRHPTDCELEVPKVRERPTPPGVIRCPICLQESHVGNDVRYVYTMLLDYARLCESEEARGERRCRTCKNEQIAVAFCKQCQADLCTSCLQAHGVMRMFDGHEAISHADLQSSGDTINVRPVLCPVHHIPFKVLCATCETLACKNCLDMEHINHKVIEVNDRVVRAIQTEIKNLAEKVDSKWLDSMSEWSAIPDRSATLNDQYEIAKARLEQTFEDLTRALEEAKIVKMNELEDARMKQEQSIEDLYRKINLNESRVNDALSFTQRLLNKANGMELVASRRKVVQQLNNLSHTMPALGIQVELEYQPLSKKQIDSQISVLTGGVVGRMVSASVKEQAPAPIEHTRVSQDNGDWNRSMSNGHPVANPTSLGAIGTERKKTIRSASEAFPGWPPCSNPPDLNTPSPPLSAQPSIQKELLNPIPMPPSMRGSNVAIPPASMWGPSANNAIDNISFGNAQLRQKVAAMIMQLPQNGVQNNNLLMQQRMGLNGHGIDPLLLGGLGNLALGNLAADGPGMGQRTSPQEASNRVPELKIHSVFGTSNQGSSIRELHCPSGFCLSDTDDILIADTNNHRVVVCGPPCPWKIGRPGTDDGMLCFPRKVVALKGDKPRYIVLDKGSDGKTRAQIFDGKGDFLKRINMTSLVPRGGIDVSAATCSAKGYLILVDTSCFVYVIDVDTPRVLHWFDASNLLGEASDVACYENNIYITDFKHHCVQIYNMEGQHMRKLGEPSQTPYPIGIDISTNGDVLVADTHGNHLHVVVFNSDGGLIQSFTHNEFRLSRCVGLRVAGSGHVVTLCKHNHTLFVFKPLYINC